MWVVEVKSKGGFIEETGEGFVCACFNLIKLFFSHLSTNNKKMVYLNLQVG